MRDIHCHILPGVDDGSQDLDTSLDMLAAAQAAGITSIVCTPHCRDPWFDFDRMWDAYYQLLPHAAGKVDLHMGFEVNHSKLMSLGLDWAPKLTFDNGREFLLELSDRCTEFDFAQYERTIYELQGMGYEVIIAHPERYAAIQKNPELAMRLVKHGCKLQASANCEGRNMFDPRRKTSKKLFEMRAYTYIASDAHYVGHYEKLAQVREKYPLGRHFK